MAKADKGLNVSIGADTSNFQKQMKELVKQSKDFSKEIKNIDRGLKFDGKNIILLKNKFGALEDQIENTKKRLELLKKQEEEFSKNGIKDKDPQAWRRLQTDIERTSGVLQGYQGQLESLKTPDVSSGFGEQFQRITEGARGAGIALAKELPRYSFEAIKGISSISVKLGESLYKGIKAGVNKTKETIREIGKTVEETGKNIESIGNKITLGVSVPVVGGLSKATKDFIDFESQANSVVKVTDFTTKEVEKSIKRISSTTPADMSGIAEIMEIGGKLKVSKTLDGLEKFAKIMIDMELATDMTGLQASEGIARFMNLIGNDAESMATRGEDYIDFVERLSSALVAVGNTSSSSESQIVDTMNSLAPLATTSKLTAQEILALAASLSDLDVQAGVAGSSSSRIFNELNRIMYESKDLAKQLSEKGFSDGVAIEKALEGIVDPEQIEKYRRLGIKTVEDLNKQIKKFDASPLKFYQDFLKDVNNMSKNGDNIDKFISSLFGENITDKNTIIRLSASYEKLGNNMKLAEKTFDKNSALSEEAAVRYKELGTRLEMLKKTLKGFGVTIGAQIGEFIGPYIDNLTKFIRKITDIDDKTGKMIIKIGIFSALIGPFLKILGKIVSKVGSSIASFESLSKVFWGLISPLSYITAGIAGLGAGMGLALKGNEKLKKQLSELKDEFGEIFLKIKEDFKSLKDTFKDSEFLSGLKDIGGDFLKGFISITEEKLLPLIERISNRFKDGSGKLKSLFDAFLKYTKRLGETFLTLYEKVLIPLIDKVFNFVSDKKVMNFLTGVLDISTKILEIFASMLKGEDIENSIDSLTGSIAKIFSNLFGQDVGKSINEIFRKITGYVEKFYKILKNDEIFKTIKDLIGDFIKFGSEILGGIVIPAVEKFWEGLSGGENLKISDIFNRISDSIGKLVKYFKDLTQNTDIFEHLGAIFKILSDTIETVLMPVFKGVVELVDNILDKFEPFKDFIEFGIKGIGDALSGILDLINGLLEGDQNKIYESLLNIGKGILEILTGFGGTIIGVLAGLLKNIVEFLVKAVVDLLTVVWDVIKSVAGSIWTWITDKASGTWAWITEKFAGVGEFLSTSIENLKTIISTGFSKVFDFITSPFRRAYNYITDIFGRIGDFFSNIHIPMPHLKIDWAEKKIFGKSVNIPDFKIDWYDKGGIFNSPQIIGVGEKRPEVVGALEDIKYIFEDSLAKHTDTQSGYGYTINVHDPVIREDQDIRRLTEYILKEIERKDRNNRRR